MSFLRRTLAAPLVVLAATASVAAAQDTPFDRGHNEGVRERGRPEYDPPGMPVGAFRLYPTLGVAAAYDDNVFATEVNEEEDTVFILSPGARLRSDWSRHALELYANADHEEYQDLDDESTTDWRAGVDGRLDILRGFVARGGLSYSDAHEPRGTNDPTLDPLREPIEVSENQASASLEREFGRLRLTGAIFNSKLDYEDGTTLSGANFDQDFRDRDLFQWSARADLALSPDTALFISYADRDHDYDAGGRDFETQQVLIGAGFDLTNLVRGELGVGQVWTEFDDPAAQDVDGLSLSGRIDWFITELTNIGFYATRDVTDAGVFTAASITRERYGARIDHELRRNVLLYAEADRYQDEYEGVDRDDETTTFAVGADYLVNRWAVIGARLSSEDKTSDGLDRDRDFERMRASIGVTFRR